MARRTGIVTHEYYYWHNAGPAAGGRRPDGRVLEVYGVAESPETKRRLHGLLAATGYIDQLVPVAPRKAERWEVEAFHSPDYVARVEAMSVEGFGDAGRGAFIGAGTYDIALLSAGGALAAIDAVCTGTVDNVYALIRPPGHHATADYGMGFCIFNNVVLAAQHARRAHGIGRIAIVDWDVHHGNGTQSAFWTDPETLTISVHQDGRFPAGMGALTERGEAAGFGANINIPLPPGSGHGAYEAVTADVIVPALDRFRPELILIACGFDAGAFDPLANMMAHSGTFASMTRSVVDAAERHAGGRLVMFHEGGYSAWHVPFCGVATIEQMSGIPSGIDDPFLTLANLPYQDLQPHQAAVISAAAALVPEIS